jgi:glycosyltransferase involved in cell wall biosynthesis
MQDMAVTHSYYQILNAKRQGKPVALSTIYWNFSEIYISEDKIKADQVKYRKSTLERRINDFLGKSLGIEIKRLSRLESLLQETRQKENNVLIKSQQLSCLLLADVLLPNAQAELDLLKRDFELAFKNAYIIPNAADLIFKYSDGKEFIKKYGINNFIMCVGRIEHIKNQLSLLKAMKGSGLPLVIIGKPGKQDYFRQCLDEADQNTTFLQPMPHDELRSAYGAAKVHVLPSWRETPGLVSLEAGLAGCNIVVTDRGSTEEYFGSLAYYCEPDDIFSIKDTIVKAYEAPKNSILVQHILNNFTWERAAEKTLAAYKSIN